MRSTTVVKPRLPAELLIARLAGIGDVKVIPGAPLIQDQARDLVDVSLLHAFGVAGSVAQPRGPGQQDKRLDPVRMRRREHHGRRAARQVARDHSPLAARLIQNRADVIDLLIHGRYRSAGSRIRQAHAPAAVEMSRLNDASRRRNRATDGSAHM
jgi:hypothetical protein